MAQKVRKVIETANKPVFEGTIIFYSSQRSYNARVFACCVCRSQETSQFQKQSGLNAQLSGMSLTGLEAGLIIGFSANPTTILKFKNELALEHPNYVCEQVKEATIIIEVITITKK